VELTDWALVDLQPGQSQRVTFEVHADQFAYVGRDLTTGVDDGEFELLTGPASARLQSISVCVRRKQ
jgi:beta-glucosidase